MIDWNKYIKEGAFKSTHGIELPFKWEFDRLEKEERDKAIIFTSVISACILNDLVVIHTVHPKILRNYAKAIYYPQTNIMKKQTHGDLGAYILYDDVITTGKSMLKCIRKIGYPPKFCLCIIDRRKDITHFSLKLKVISIKTYILGGF